MGIYLFLLCTWWGEDNFTWYYVRCFHNHCKRYMVSYFVRIYPCLCAPYLTIFVPSSWYCVINQSCPHITRSCYCWPHSSWFGFISYSFSWGYGDSCNSSEGWSLSRLIFSRHDFPSSYGGFSDVYSSKWTSFFIDVPTWCEEQKPLEALFFQFCTHYINKRC
jgi:hypothetical protein